MECLPNRLTLLYSKIYYKKENYLKVKTAVFKYINSSIVKFSTSVRRYIWYVSIYITTCLGYPSSYSFTGFISSASCALILTQYKSLFSTCTILFIRSVTPAFFFISLSSKNLISKLLIKGVLCFILI